MQNAEASGIWPGRAAARGHFTTMRASSKEKEKEPIKDLASQPGGLGKQRMET